MTGGRRVMRVLLVLGVALAQQMTSKLDVFVMSKAFETLERASPSQRLAYARDAVRVWQFAALCDVVRLTRQRLESSSQDRFDTAVHEAAHAVAILTAQRSLPRSIKLRRVKLIVGSTAGAAGLTSYLPGRKLYMPEATHLRALIGIALAGRAAEQELLGRVSAGASSDIQFANRIARAYVCAYGFGRRGLSATVDGMDINADAETKREVRRLLESVYADALRDARKGRHEIEVVAKALLVRENLGARATQKLVAKAQANQSYEVSDRFRRYHWPKQGLSWWRQPSQPPDVVTHRFAAFELGRGLFALVRCAWGFAVILRSLENGIAVMSEREKQAAAAGAPKQQQSLPHKSHAPPPSVLRSGLRFKMPSVLAPPKRSAF